MTLQAGLPYSYNNYLLKEVQNMRSGQLCFERKVIKVLSVVDLIVFGRREFR